MGIESVFSLHGQTIVVTGAAGGIGRATAGICAEQGASRLVLVDRAPIATGDDDGALANASVETRRIDTSDRSAVEALARDVGTVDGLVDMAGVAAFDDWSEADWDQSFDRVVDVNIRGPINLARAFFDGMCAAGRGRIVLAGSVAGWMGGLRTGPHYAFSKGGLHAFTRWLALKGAPFDVLVNAIAPGPVDTGMTAGKGYDPQAYPLRRMARPKEIAAMAAFLLSPGGGYTTGAVMDVNGGTHLR